MYSDSFSGSYCGGRWVAFIAIIVIASTSKVCKSQRQQRPRDKEEYTQQSTLIKLLGEAAIYHEISNFLTDAREKLETDCTTVIWDYKFSTVLDSLKFCGEGDLKQTCVPVYSVCYNKDLNNNVTDEAVRTLKEAYGRKCGGYILVLRSSSAVVDLLHYGDDFRLINTRARFLIWYAFVDKTFESDDIWKKVSNAILFHTKLGYRSRKRMTFTIKSFKWPVLPNVPDPTRVVDFWSQGKYFGRSNEGWYRDKTNNLRNITLRIIAVEHPPGVIKYETTDGKVEFAGNEVEIVKELSDIMNFDYEFLEVDWEDKIGGQGNGNSTPQFFDALTRLIYGEADMAIGSFFVLKNYLDSLDMSIPLDVACTTFITPNPLSRPRYLALILPFNNKLWALVLSICFIFAPFGLFLLSKLPVHKTEYRVFTGRTHVVFTSFSIMSQVALHLWPKFWPIRMFIGWFWMFCLLITLAYRGAYISFLTIPLFQSPIDNINDLAASGLRIGGWGAELERLFKQYTDTNGESNAKSLLKNRYDVVDDVNTAISWVAMGEFAVYENLRFLKFVRQTRNLSRLGYPSMRIMKQCIVPVHIGIAYQKNSPIVPTINQHIRRFQESGLIKRWSQRLIARTKQHYQRLARENAEMFDHDHDHHHDDDDDDDEEENDEDVASGSSKTKRRKQRVLNMRDLQGSIYLICFGFFLSGIAFVIEIFAAHSRNAAQNVNKELKKMKDKATGKGMFVGDDEHHHQEDNDKGDEGDEEKESYSEGVGCWDDDGRSGKRKKENDNGGDAWYFASSSSKRRKEAAAVAAPTTSFNITSKNQFLANMLMEYEGVVRRTQSESESRREAEKTRKFTLKRSKGKRDSVRVRTSDNREEYFSYMQ